MRRKKEEGCRKKMHQASLGTKRSLKLFFVNVQDDQMRYIQKIK
jgi:hypothetical protein